MGVQQYTLKALPSIYLSICIYTYIYTHIIYIHTYTYIHTYIYMYVQGHVVNENKFPDLRCPIPLGLLIQIAEFESWKDSKISQSGFHKMDSAWKQKQYLENLPMVFANQVKLEGIPEPLKSRNRAAQFLSSEVIEAVLTCEPKPYKNSRLWPLN